MTSVAGLPSSAEISRIEPWESLKGGAQRQDAHAENGSLQLADEAVERGVPVLERHGECGTVVLCELDRVADRVFRDRELTGQPDERIDAVGIDAQRLRVGRRDGVRQQARPRLAARRSPRALVAEACRSRASVAFGDRRGRRGGNVVGLRESAEVAQHVRGDEPCRSDAAVLVRSPAVASNAT